MKRHVFNFLAAVSLLACAAVCVLWASSYLFVQGVRYGRVPFSASVDSQQGLCRVDWTTHWPGLSYGLAGAQKVLTPEHRERGSGYFLRECGSRVGGFGWGRETMPVVTLTPGGPGGPFILMTFNVLVVPHWFLAAATAVLPALWFLRRRRGRHSGPGVCRACGYDLRATPDKCPECGAVPSTGKTTS
jgi:hypothetical protein